MKYAIPLVFTALLVGCSQEGGFKLAKVSGTVTLDGQPVAGAGLEFVADAGGVAYGRTDASGRYYMSFGNSRTGAIVGRNQVRITAGDRVTVGEKNTNRPKCFLRSTTRKASWSSRWPPAATRSISNANPPASNQFKYLRARAVIEQIRNVVGSAHPTFFWLSRRIILRALNDTPISSKGECPCAGCLL